MESYYEIHKEYHPSLLKLRNEFKEITFVKDEYIIKNVKIFYTKVEDGIKVGKVFIDAKHPNSDPRTNEFCVATEIKNLKSIDINVLIPLLEQMFTTYNLDNPYYSPFGDFKYKR